ncbi:MAG: hypothetical protein ABIJ28_02450 [Patescibacteria group bacterium]
MEITRKEVKIPDFFKPALKTVSCVASLEGVLAETNQVIEILKKEKEELAKSNIRVETNLQPELTEKITEAESRRKGLMRIQQLGHLPVLSLDFLSWRNDEGWPAVAILNLDCAYMQFGVYCYKQEIKERLKKLFSNEKHFDYTYSYRIEPSYPDIIKKHFHDIEIKLRELAAEEKQNVSIKTSCQGLVPSHVRETIAQSFELFPGSIYLIAQVEKWKLSYTEPLSGTCPLVGGFDGEKFWILDRFDLTTVEQFIQNHFTAKRG